ncbi:MAG: MBL fold metallo-hydrolase [Candidatus Latescibacteria bacterium]|nr:MBL fold metallo-hydrolase [Candidatus Latescibacterota bacterium]
MQVVFWGVRGSYPVARADCLRYGGNTPCIELEAGGQCVLVDAGTGIRAAGQALVERGVEDIHLLLSHTHWDHIQGLPHFAPLYRDNTRLRIYGLKRGDCSLEEVFRAQQQQPFYPVPLDSVPAQVEFVELTDGQSWCIGDVDIECRRLNHPGVAGGYRVVHQGTAFAYICDTDLVTDDLLGDEMPDSREYRQRLRDNVRDLAHRGDLIVCDTFFLPQEYRADFGHSSAEDALRLGREVEARCVTFFHHAPQRSDGEMDQLVADFRALGQEGPEMLAAAEGVQLAL